MKTKTHIERGSTSAGVPVFRWYCDCGRRGVWLQNLNEAERNGALHQSTDHPKTAVA